MSTPVNDSKRALPRIVRVLAFIAWILCMALWLPFAVMDSWLELMADKLKRVWGQK